MQRFSDATNPLAKSVARIRGVLWAVFRPFFNFIPFLAVLLFFGALFWAKAQDPFSRKWVTLKVSISSPLLTKQNQPPSPQPSPPGEGESHPLSPPGRSEGERSVREVKCVVVLPKPIRPCPVVVYAHGSGGNLMNDGNDLRQTAELGVAVVSLEYDQTNEAAFDGQFEGVLNYLGRQNWANTNAIAWVGFSLGANRMLDFAVQHPELQPKLMVQLSGAGLNQSTLNSSSRQSVAATDQLSTKLHCPVLLVHGEQDETFPVPDTRRLASVLQTNGVPVELRIVPGAPHGMEPDTGVVFRCIGEYCLTHLDGKNAWQNYHSIAQWQAEGPSLWLFWIPAMAWVVGRVIFSKGGTLRCGVRSAQRADPTIKLKRHEIALRWVAALLAAWALTVTAIHLLPPHFLVTETTLAIARKHLVEPKQTADFECLATQPIWRGQKLRTLLDHVELAGYNRELINWQLEDKLYRDYVLSPVITGQPGEQLNWRRPLWEEFYPRIRHENSPEDAARIVVRHLRERVTIAAIPDLPHEVPAIWLRQITDEAGFEIIHVAALRSVGVPARLNGQQKAEFWNGREWVAAPEPAVMSW
jgi:acetyl esterase/lipase